MKEIQNILDTPLLSVEISSSTQLFADVVRNIWTSILVPEFLQTVFLAVRKGINSRKDTLRQKL